MKKMLLIFVDYITKSNKYEKKTNTYFMLRKVKICLDEIFYNL
jgi:hypothetical protein